MDYDRISGLQVVKAYYYLAYGAGEAWIRRSASGLGLHLKAHGLPLSFEEALEIRETLRDDNVRIRFDRERRPKPKQVLWTCKNGNYAGKWTRDLWAVLDLPVQVEA